MTDVTIRQFADVVGLPVDRLLVQLGEAGLSIAGADDTISDQEKMQLLTYLRRSHGKSEVAGAGGAAGRRLHHPRSEGRREHQRVGEPRPRGSQRASETGWPAPAREQSGAACDRAGAPVQRPRRERPRSPRRREASKGRPFRTPCIADRTT